MNVKNWIPLVAAVLLGLIALVVARKALSKGGGDSAKGESTTIVVAARDLPANTVIKADDLVAKKVPAESIIGGSFRTPQEAAGRTIMHPVSKDDVVIEPLLIPAGGVGGLSSYVSKGLRAMTLEVNEFTGVAGMIQPGAKVDVIAILRDKKSDQPVARTILQDIMVRAVGRNITPPPAVEGQGAPPPTNNVTLLVTQRQAQMLQLASQSGRPWLVLRGSQDHDVVVDAEASTLAELRGEASEAAGGQRPVMPVADGSPLAGDPASGADPFGAGKSPVASARVVQIIRGGVESTVTFPGVAEPKPAPVEVKPTPTEPRRMITGTNVESQKPE